MPVIERVTEEKVLGYSCNLQHRYVRIKCTMSDGTTKTLYYTQCTALVALPSEDQPYVSVPVTDK